MLGSYIYWISTAALILCLYLSLMRRQTVRELAEARRKLLDEHQERDQMRAELVHAHATAEKDVAAAKKQVTEAKSTIAEFEELKSKLEQERDALRVELDALRVSLGDRTAAEESAKKQIAELETQVNVAREGQDKLGAVGRELQATLSKIEALEKKIEAEARLRKAAEEERNVAKSTVTTFESKHRDAERAKAALVESHAKEVQALRATSSSLEAEAKDAKERLAKAEEELTTERSKVQTASTPAASAASAGGGDILAAIDADPYLNRGQKETIRMTYNQFTAKRRASS